VKHQTRFSSKSWSENTCGLRIESLVDFTSFSVFAGLADGSSDETGNRMITFLKQLSCYLDLSRKVDNTEYSLIPLSLSK